MYELYSIWILYSFQDIWIPSLLCQEKEYAIWERYCTLWYKTYVLYHKVQ